MIKGFLTALLLVSASFAFYLNQNVSRSIQLKPLNYARAITSNIKEIQTPQGKIELPKSLQKITPEEIRSKPDQRIFDICWYLQREHKINPQDCFKSVAEMKVSERQSLNADMVLKGMDGFKSEIDSIMKERREERKTESAPTPKGQADGRLKTALMKNLDGIFKKKAQDRIDNIVKTAFTRKIDTKIDDIVDKKLESKKVTKIEEKVEEKFMAMDGSFTKDQIKEKLSVALPEMEEKGLADIKKIEDKEANEITEEFKKDSESVIRTEIKAEVQEQKQLILENLKDELGGNKDTKVEDTPELVQQSHELENQIDAEVEKRLKEFEAKESEEFDRQVEAKFKQRLQEKLDQKAQKIAREEKKTSDF